MGALSGNPVGGLYNNWGNEPDDFGGGQDALGLSLNGMALFLLTYENPRGFSVLCILAKLSTKPRNYS